ncbi:MAG: heme-copper oxidase subunit III [Elusimicrobiota bacterium]
MEQSINKESIAGISTGKIGMWTFLVSEIMFFTGLIGSYIVLRFGASSWPNPSEFLNTKILTFNTLVLLTSSLTMALSVDAAQKNDMSKLLKNLFLTLLLGIIFLVVKAYDYVHMWGNGFTISTNLLGSFYYLITAFHGLHVLSGLIFILTLIVGVKKGRYSSSNYGRIEYCGLYWHFVDIIWVIVFGAVCLI